MRSDARSDHSAPDKSAPSCCLSLGLAHRWLEEQAAGPTHPAPPRCVWDPTPLAKTPRSLLPCLPNFTLSPNTVLGTPPAWWHLKTPVGSNPLPVYAAQKTQEPRVKPRVNPEGPGGPHIPAPGPICTSSASRWLCRRSGWALPCSHADPHALARLPQTGLVSPFPPVTSPYTGRLGEAASAGPPLPRSDPAHIARGSPLLPPQRPSRVPWPSWGSGVCKNTNPGSLQQGLSPSHCPRPSATGARRRAGHQATAQLTFAERIKAEKGGEGGRRREGTPSAATGPRQPATPAWGRARDLVISLRTHRLAFVLWPWKWVLVCLSPRAAISGATGVCPTRVSARRQGHSASVSEQVLRRDGASLGSSAPMSRAPCSAGRRVSAGT